MKIEVSMKEVLFGVVGTVLGGLMVTLLANNHSLESQLKAISIIDEPLQQAIEKTTRADTNATNAIARLRQVQREVCLLYTSPSPRDRTRSRMPSSA